MKLSEYTDDELLEEVVHLIKKRGLSEFSDDELLEEVKHRGFEIKIIQSNIYQVSADRPNKISIGGIVFELTS